MRRLIERLEEKAQDSGGCVTLRCDELEDWFKKRFSVEFMGEEGSDARAKVIYFLTEKGRKRGQKSPDHVVEVYWRKAGETRGRRVEAVSMRHDWITRDRKTFDTTKDLKAMDKWLKDKISEGKERWPQNR